jgi:proprotein convertase subtilisin/kexin type 5
MYDELMTRTPLSAQRGISSLTFALFKDMGWYTVDDTFNDTSPYGYQKGCDFFNNGCNSSTAYIEFCTTGSNIKSCTSQSLSKSTCQIDAYSDNCGIWIGTLNCVDVDAQSDGYKSLCQ